MRTPAWLTGIGADPRDDEDLPQKKSLLVLLAVLILPVSIVWGTCYLAFGSPVGIIPFVYFAVSIGSLLVFAKTRNFVPFLTTQLLDILLRFLKTEQIPSIRRETIRVLGILGALDPYKQKVHAFRPI